MNRGARIVRAISDRTNPIVVKELRQAVQSRLVIAILLLFLLANVVIVCGSLILNGNALTNEQAGLGLFDGLFAVLVATCMIFVPLYTAARLTMERNDSNIDLLFITTIAPAAIIRGKFWSALALTGLIYSASMPFLTFTYLLRGIDLPSIFLALAFAFLATAEIILLAILAGSLAGGLFLRIILAGGLIFFGGYAMVGAIFGGMAIVMTGQASLFANNEAWAALGLGILLGLAAGGVIYLLAVAAVSARSSNRMFPLRVFVTVCWLILGVVSGIASWLLASTEPVLVWSVTSVGLLSLVLAFIVAERESWTPRVRRHIPPGNPLRILAWLFYTGSAGGVIWCCAMSALTLLAGYAMIGVSRMFPRTEDAKDALRIVLGVLLFTWCYTMSGVFARRIIAPKSQPILSTILGLMLLAVCSAAPLFVAFFYCGPDWRVQTLPVGFVIANPLVLGRSGEDRVVAEFFLAAWAFLALSVNIPWFFQQWRAFRRHEPKPVPALASLAEEPPVVHA